MHQKKQDSDIALTKVISDLVSKGYEIYLPLVDRYKTDLIASKDNKTYRIQVKYRKDGLVCNSTSSMLSNGPIRRYYEDNDFDYYAIYLPSVDKIVYPSIKFGGCIITTKVNLNNSYHYYWYEDFLEFTDIAEKRFNQAPTLYKKPVRKFKDKLNWPSLEEFTNMVNTMTLKEIAKKIGCSDIAVAKRIKKLDIIRK